LNESGGKAAGTWQETRDIWFVKIEATAAKLEGLCLLSTFYLLYAG
jgi:hypothetical protein